MRVSKAKTRAAQVAPVIDELRASGMNTLRELAKGLNERGILAPRGGRWAASQVRATLLALD